MPSSDFIGDGGVETSLDAARTSACATLPVALLCDFREEGWPSMDLVADMLYAALAERVNVAAIRPDYRRLPWGPARNAERFLNRFVVYPRVLRDLRDRYGLFHVIDHSYAHLCLCLPAGRAVVHCHDLDTFRCLIEPEKDPRPAWFRAMAGRILNGFRRAAHIISVSRQTRAELLHHNLADPQKVTVVPNGISPEFFAGVDPAATGKARELLGRHAGKPYLINVGSTIARKRIEYLLEIFAAARTTFPDLHLVRVGSGFTARQQSLVDRLRLNDHITCLNGVPRGVLAALYQNAVAALQPSASEGFGLPIAEAMASMCPVIATDLPIFREVAGDAASLVGAKDPVAWVSSIETMFQPSSRQHFMEAGRRRSCLFTWEETARRVAEIYQHYAPHASLVKAAANHP